MKNMNGKKFVFPEFIYDGLNIDINFLAGIE